MKKIISYFTAAAIAACTAASAASLKSIKNQTVFIYMISSDMTEFAEADISEMLGSGFSGGGADVILIAGGGSGTNGIFSISDGNMQKLEDISGYNMFDTDDIYDIMFRYMARYRADKYSVFFWDHGGGFANGFGRDCTDENAAISVSDLAKVFSDIKQDVKEDYGLQYNYETIGFDACYMSDIQSQHAFADAGFRYFIASEGIESSTGWDYGFLECLNRSPDMDGNELCRIITDTVEEYNRNNNIKKSSSVISTDLLKISAVTDELEKTARILSSCDTEDIYSARTVSKSFGAENEYTDISDFADNLGNIGINASTLSEAADSAVIYRSRDCTDGGISVYFPMHGSVSPEWNRLTSDEFKDYKYALNNISYTIYNTDAAEFSESGSVARNKNTYTYIPGDDAIRDMRGARFAVYKSENGIYRPVISTDAVDITGNMLTADYDNTALVLKSGNISYPVGLNIRGGKYYVNITKDTGNCGAAADMRPMEIELDSRCNIINTQYSDNTPLAAKDDAALCTGDRIYDSAQSYNTDNTPASVIPDIITVHNPKFETITLFGDYVCRFEIINAYGYVEHCSPMTEIHTGISENTALSVTLSARPHTITACSDTIALPCALDELTALGYESDNIPAVINPGSVYGTMHKGSEYIDISLTNNGGAPADAKECVVTAISVTDGSYGTLKPGYKTKGENADLVYITQNSVRYIYRLGGDSVLPDFSGDLGLNGLYVGICSGYAVAEASRSDGTIRRISLVSGAYGTDYTLRYFIY